MRVKKIGLIIVFFLILLFLFFEDPTEFNNDKRLEKSEEILPCIDCNVILILVDTLRADHVGAYGYYRNTTPNIDKLAEEAILFKNTIAQSSWTRPSVASILTGLYLKNQNIQGTYGPLPEEHLLLPEILQDFGYYTHLFLGNPMCKSGFTQGYDKVNEYPINTSTRHNHVVSDEMHKDIINTIENLTNKNNNFFFIHYMDPHDPYTPKERVFSKTNSIDFSAAFLRNKCEYKKLEGCEKLNHSEQLIREMINAYDDEIKWNDKSIGKILEALKANKIYNNSIIVIVSDHGEEFMEHSELVHGKNLYDATLKIPLIIKIPQTEKRVISGQVELIDILPTVLKILNIQIPENIDGEDILSKEKEHSFAELVTKYEDFSSIRSLKNKLIINKKKSIIEDEFFWFEGTAGFPLRDNQLNLEMASFLINRTIEIYVGKTRAAEISLPPVKTNISIDLSPFQYDQILQPVKKIVINSKTPCEKPFNLGINSDLRCLSFRIFNSLSFNKSQAYEVNPRQTKEFFLIEKDVNEQNNFYDSYLYQDKVKKLEKELNFFDKDKKASSKSNEKEFIIQKEELEILKALGYLN